MASGNSLLKSGYTAVSHAVERRRYPERFIKVGQTPRKVIYRDGIMSLSHYPALKSKAITVEDEDIPVSDIRHKIPIVLVPALGIHAWTFDIMPERSMVRFLMAQGFDVYLIDWGQPSQAERDIDLNTYVNQWLPAAVNKTMEYSGAESVSLVGYCMGGLLCMMYLGAWHDAPVRNLVTIASPVNFHKSGPMGALASLLSIPAMKVHDWFQVRLAPIDSKTFHIPGKLLSLGFKLTNPPAVVSSYLDLVRNITDREYITEYMTIGQWFNDMVDYPGGTVRELIEKMIIANNLADGRIAIGNRIANFALVRNNLLALAGATDRIVSQRAAKDILRVAGSRNKRFEVVPGGHAGIFAGSKAPANSWRLISDWLAEFSD